MIIRSIRDSKFKTYGKVITGIDFDDMIAAMEETPLPEDVQYVPSIQSLESCKSTELLRNHVYGGMPIQIGYCNGHNKLLNAVEYHRDSEVDLAVTDLILLLGRLQDVQDDFSYDTANIEAFRVPAGTAVELYGTTLHYAPCQVDDGGFKCAVVLPEGTNLDRPEIAHLIPEDVLLYARNKWLIAHPDAKIKGAFNGLVGENICPEP